MSRIAERPAAPAAREFPARRERSLLRAALYGVLGLAVALVVTGPPAAIEHTLLIVATVALAGLACSARR